ncbi:MAG: hypothetical protein J5850_01290 [Clostridia bacterium]|nr:hypothetical protein [Clostridia bacterium]
MATGALHKNTTDEITTTSSITTEYRPATSDLPLTTAPVTVTTEPQTTPVKPEAPTYYDNLSHVLGYKSIDGLVASRKEITLSARIANHQRLTGTFAAYEDDDYDNIIVSDDFDSSTDYIVKGKVLAKDYSSGGTKTVTKYRKEDNINDDSYHTVAKKITVARPTVEAYMGFLIITTDDGAKQSLCDGFGNLLCPDIDGLEPYYGRDMSNHPVFSKVIEGEERYFIFDAKNLSFREIEKKDIRVGLRYDYPAYEYAPYGYEVVWDQESESYRYYYKSRRTYRYDYYYYGFNYSEERTVMVLQDGVQVVYVDRGGYRCFSKSKKYNLPERSGIPGQDMWVLDFYVLPDTLGIESIGTAGYDHGWVRTRIQTRSQMKGTFNKIVVDTDTLIDYKGKHFAIPEGYQLEGYSDGVLLLSKNGLYGYYTINHEWIARPIYTYAMPFVQGLAVLGYEDGTVGMIDTRGNIVMPFVYTSLSLPSSGVITAFCEGIGWETYYMVRSTEETE